MVCLLPTGLHFQKVWIKRVFEKLLTRNFLKVLKSCASKALPPPPFRYWTRYGRWIQLSAAVLNRAFFLLWAIQIISGRWLYGLWPTHFHFLKKMNVSNMRITYYARRDWLESGMMHSYVTGAILPYILPRRIDEDPKGYLKKNRCLAKE